MAGGGSHQLHRQDGRGTAARFPAKSCSDRRTRAGPGPNQNCSPPQGQENAHLLELSDGRLLCSFTSRIPGLFGIVLRMSSNGGDSWSYPVTLLSTPAYDWHKTDAGYPSSVQLDDGAIVTAYYFGPRKPEWAAHGLPWHQRYHMGAVRWDLSIVARGTRNAELTSYTLARKDQVNLSGRDSCLGSRENHWRRPCGLKKETPAAGELPSRPHRASRITSHGLSPRTSLNRWRGPLYSSLANSLKPSGFLQWRISMNKIIAVLAAVDARFQRQHAVSRRGPRPSGKGDRGIRRRRSKDRSG